MWLAGGQAGWPAGSRRQRQAGRRTHAGAHLTSCRRPRMGVCCVASSHSTTPAFRKGAGRWQGGGASNAWAEGGGGGETGAAELPPERGGRGAAAGGSRFGAARRAGRCRSRARQEQSIGQRRTHRMNKCLRPPCSARPTASPAPPAQHSTARAAREGQRRHGARLVSRGRSRRARPNRGRQHAGSGRAAAARRQRRQGGRAQGAQAAARPPSSARSPARASPRRACPRCRSRRCTLLQ